MIEFRNTPIVSILNISTSNNNNNIQSFFTFTDAFTFDCLSRVTIVYHDRGNDVINPHYYTRTRMIDIVRSHHCGDV